MKIENPAALRFIIDDDLYLLGSDKIAQQITVVQPVIETPVISPVLQSPVMEPAAQSPVLQPQTETAVVNFKYKGANKKNFLVLVNYADSAFIEEAHLTALENILKRKELGLDDIAIVNLANYPNQPKKELIDFFNPERLLIMGAAALPGDLSAPAFNQSTQTEGIKMLYSFSFDEMMDSNDNKKAFWEQMKTL